MSRTQINGGYTSSNGDLWYIPLNGTITENPSYDPAKPEAIYVPNGAGKLISISIIPTTTMGDAEVSIWDDNIGGTIGTKTASCSSGTITTIDFTTGVTGTNEFDGDGTIAIGIDPSINGVSVNFSLIFEL